MPARQDVTQGLKEGSYIDVDGLSSVSFLDDSLTPHSQC